MPILEKKIDIDAINLSEEQLSIKNIIENTNKHIFITGKAGTGKSTLLLALKATMKKRFVVVAPTGVAAINVSGQTIHSLFQLPPKFITEEDISVSKQKKKLLKTIDTVIIDEISMVRADLMDAIDIVLRKARLNDAPFGGVQIIMFGDLYQLPPIISDENLEQYFMKEFGGVYFFNAKVWKHNQFEKYELKTIFRQEDSKFKTVLNCIREGNYNLEMLALLNERAKVLVPKDGFVTLASTNYKVNQINENHLRQLTDGLFTYEASIDGDFDQSSFPAEQLLKLKKGAQIMLLKNDKQKRWVNGTIGYVHSLSKDEIKVSIKDKVYPVYKEAWDKIRYSYDSKTNSINEESIASFTQYPLKLAWAITIHKAQGKTLDSVLIDLGTGAFACGQTYVALSRCTSLNGIYLKREITPKDIIVDSKIIDFMKSSEIY